MLRDKRLQPRHYLKFPVAINMGEILPEGCKTESVNISRNAMELRCNSEVMAAFQAQHGYPQTCQVAFRLPDSPYGFAIQCQLITYRRLSQHRYHAVLGFAEYEEGCAELLAEGLNHASPPCPEQMPAHAAWG